MMYSTKEAAHVLQVSPTTIKRWASHFQNRFSKDELGHYVFEEGDMENLAIIKKQLEMKLSLSQIVLPDADPVPQQSKAEPVYAGQASGSRVAPVTQMTAPYGEIEKRLRYVESKLSEKADDIVCLQLLEHRRELEELSRTVKQLTQHMEEVACSLSDLNKQSEALAYQHKPAKRRRLLASLFQF
ncbi:MerR family transcriptional regulator [Paenibacillus allorhizosphaerae]|uniref:Chromosome-anchoring protein RacA n=1 Tax=Paenibacillus allorhizosphaerae TaxID=2849866 RepID=A0ABN7TH89_9BACL|nr:MerR family transcriptional regulator [Paenibacillus allorhizosphaerae]CAG7625187.1 Chromosome-anchoring protein RacA [Paenibacillus allorhizosphaerae]